MTEPVTHRDLIVLVADADIREVIHGVLHREDELAIRAVDFEIQVHPNRDAGCRTDAADFLRTFLRRFRHCIVVFDRHGCGSGESREEIQQAVESELARNGWNERAKVIVIDPELEAWIWGDLKATSEHVGWTGAHTGLRQWLVESEFWPSGRKKPEDPKRAMQEAMLHSPARHRPRRSPRIFSKIARDAELTHCRDPSFNELRSTLTWWFPSR